MPLQTKTFTCDNVSKTAITVKSNGCKRVRLREDPSVAGFPTQGFQIFAPTQADQAVQFQPQEFIDFEAGSYRSGGGGAFFRAGQIIGYITSLVSSTTIQQLED